MALLRLMSEEYAVTIRKSDVCMKIVRYPDCPLSEIVYEWKCPDCGNLNQDGDSPEEVKSYTCECCDKLVGIMEDHRDWKTIDVENAKIDIQIQHIKTYLTHKDGYEALRDIINFINDNTTHITTYRQSGGECMDSVICGEPPYSQCRCGSTTFRQGQAGGKYCIVCGRYNGECINVIEMEDIPADFNDAVDEDFWELF